MSDDELIDVPIESLPLDGWHRAHGARMVEFAGYHMPIQFEGIMAEHLWTRESAGLFDVSHMGQLLFSSETTDVAAALEGVLPGDVQGLAPGRMRYSLLLNGAGGILDDLMVTRLQGPKAVDALERLVPGVSALRFMQAAGFERRGVPLWISRSGYTGEDGFEISIPAEDAEAFATALLEQAEVKPIGLGARDSLRLEAGLPLYGHDLDEQTTPVMADLGFAIAKRRREAGDFPGAARIAIERAQGPAQKRVGLLIEGRQPVREGAVVLDEGANEAGRVTSGGFAPTVGAPIAMAYVPLALAAPGTRVQLAQRGKVHWGTVTPLPFVPHRYIR